VFEPFFTTKPPGVGTGLGLSQVHGFIKQSGGHIRIYSEVGTGTSIKLYLPRSSAEPEPAPTQAAQPDPMARRGITVLVVEDEAGVREFAVEALATLGFDVLAADGAAAALRLLDAHPEIGLLLTDVVMPEVNGRVLADEALRRRPDLKVVFMTGYTRNAIIHNGVLDPGTHLVSKPFTVAQLADELNATLA
jgi:CheY-like chemotaxis protein